MQSQIAKIILICFASLMAFHVAAQETLSVSVLNGTEIRCYPDSLVRIEITPNTDFDFSLIVIDWGDGVTEQVNPGESLILEHEYPIAQFLEECEYDMCGTTGGFCFQLVIDAAYGGQTPDENISKRITFKFPPRPNFDPDLGYICPGVDVTLSNFTCPSNDNSMRYYWAFPDGSTSTDAEPTYNFDAPGTYPVTLSAANECDSITVTRNIVVNELAEAGITADFGFEDTSSEPYVVCISDGGKINLTADGSSNATEYDWGIDPNGDFVLEDDPSNDSLCIRFEPTASGVYTVELEVNNACDVPDAEQLEVEVIPEVSLNLQPQEDGCLSLEYSPEPLQPGVAYNLNGTLYSDTDFPVTLTDSDQPYIMEATASNRCDSLVRRDTFFVFGEFDPSITMPAQDTVVCRDTAFLALATDGQGAGWSVDDGAPLVFEEGEVLFDMNQADGVYSVSFSQGFGACEGTASRSITIQSPEVSTEGPWQFCADEGVQTLGAMPDSGSWSGPGIVDPAGSFDPASIAPGSYEIFYTFDDVGLTGCVTTLSDMVEVVALPTLDGLPSTFAVCDVDEVLSLSSLTGISFDPASGTSQWSGQGIVEAANGDYNPALVNGGTDTVAVAYTIEPGCTVADTTVVTIDSLTEVEAGEDIILCDNEDNPTLDAEPAGQGRWLGPSIDESTGEINLNNLSAGQTYAYIYIINEDFPSCTNSDTVEVTVASGQGVSLPLNEAYLCDTADVLLLPTGSPATGSWSGSPNLSNDTLYLAGLTPDTFDLVYIIPDLPAACNSDALSVYLSPQPAVSITSDSTACVGSDCLPFAAVAGGATAFEWSFGDGSGSGETAPCHTYTETGVFPVTLTGYLEQPGTNTLYCASEPANTTVEILGAMEEVAIDASSLEECPVYLVDLSPAVLDDRYTYNWSVANIQDSVSTNLQGVLLPGTAEDTTYTAVLSTTNGCDTRVDSVELTALAPFQANVATDFDSPCSGETVSLYNLCTGVDSGTMQWSISNGINYTGFEPPAFQVFTDSLPTTLEVTLVGSNACNSDTASYAIEVQPTDVRARMNFSEQALCAGAALDMVNISTPNAPVRWVTSDGNNYQGDTVSHVFNEAGEAWVTIYAEGCGFDSLRYPFVVHPRPIFDLEVPPIACASNPVSFAVSGDLAAQRLFYGTGDSTLLRNSTYLYEQADVYEINLYGLSALGCQDSLQRSIEIAPLPEAVAAPVDSVCVGEAVTLSSQSSGASACLWRMADGGQRDNCQSTYTFQSSGLQINTLIAMSDSGCVDSTLFPVFVRPTPIAELDYLNNDACSPAIVQFNFIRNGPDPDSWRWSFGDGNMANIADPLHTYSFGGSYDVELIVGVNGICFDTTSQNIMVRGTPQFDTLTLDERCLPTDAFILEVNTDEANEVTLTGDGFYQAGISRFELTESGNYELEVLNPSGCDTTLQIVVPQVFPLEVELMPDTTILLGASIQLGNKVNAAGLIVDWTPGSGLDDSTALEPIAMPGQTTTYIISVSDGDCFAQDTITVFVDEQVSIYVPNAFSPNGDGVNDRFTIYPAIGVESVLSCRIFDRWGELNYEMTDEMEPQAGAVELWDGGFKGETLQGAVFAYYIELLLTNGDTKVIYGDLQLVR